MLESVRRLSGRAFQLAVSRAEQVTEQLVLLTHSPADRVRNRDIARDEFRLLQTLKRAGLPVAQPLYLARDHAPPYFIVSRIPGSPRIAADDAPAFCRRLAEVLARRDLSFLPRQADRLAEYLDAAATADERIRDAMRGAAHRIRSNGRALLHGDFWLGNLLWQGDRLSGIIDWEDAMLGDPLADLGKSRLEMLWALGEQAMAEFSARYLALNPQLDASALPFWDLWGAARLPHYASFAADASNAAAMRRQYDRFIQAAIDTLAAGEE